MNDRYKAEVVEVEEGITETYVYDTEQSSAEPIGSVRKDDYGQWAAFHVETERERAFSSRSAAVRGLQVIHEHGDEGFDELEEKMEERNLLERFYATGRVPTVL